VKTFLAGIQAWVWDVVGLGFAGTAVYGLITGRVSASALTTSLALAAAYLGLKAPGNPTNPTPGAPAA
jgi:hypothetical protein